MRLIPRVLLALLLVLVTSAVGVGVGARLAGADCGNESGGSYVECGGSDHGQDDGADHVGGVPVPVDFELVFVRDGEGEDEGDVPYEGCWGIAAVPEGEGVSWAEAVEEQLYWGENGGSWGTCDVEETIDPAMLAAAYWYASAAPPPPTPLVVAPGEARTGLPAYLEIGGDVPFTQTLPTPIGALSFSMTPRYVVSWGDGSTTQTSSQGTPPGGGEGAITHTYVDDGDVTITVEAYWRTTWSLAGAGGDLPELPVPTTASLDLPVEQRQAVVD